MWNVFKIFLLESSCLMQRINWTHICLKPTVCQLLSILAPEAFAPFLENESNIEPVE